MTNSEKDFNLEMNNMKLPIKIPFQKLFLATTVGFLLSVFATQGAFAKYTVPQGTGNFVNTYKQALEQTDTNLPQWSLSNLNYIPSGLTRLFIGVPTLTGEKATSGATGMFAGLVGNMYQNRPTSSGQYFADLGGRLGIVKPVYAQGEGWNFLSPILDLWKAVRDIAYLFFVVAFVALGFTIMLRKKVDSQTVVSIQFALPKIIVSLILVTFSYAICGLMVDLVFLGNQLMNSAFIVAFTKLGGGGYSWIDKFFPITYSGVVMGGTNVIDIIVQGIRIILQLVGVINGDFVGIFNLVIAFTVLSSVIKIFFVLMSKYVTIIISTVFSPLIFLWSTFPGQEEHKSKFIKSFLSAVITFPAMLLILNLAAAIMIGGQAGLIKLSDLAPFTTDWVKGGAPAQVMTTLASFVALGILMTASKIGEIIDDALAVKGGGPTLGTEAAGVLRRIPVIGSFLG